MSHPYSNVAIAGAFNTKQARRLEDHTSASIALEGALGVIAETGVKRDDIDGVFGAFCGEVGYHLGLNSYSSSGVSNLGIAAVLEAAQAIQVGMCHTALVTAGGAGLYVDRTATAPWTRPGNEWVVPYGLFTTAEFALVARRHMHRYGTTPEQLATVAATIRNNGHVNPEAVYFRRGPYSPEDILDSRMIADPYHLLDCATTSEGGCAIVMTTPERCADLALPPVHILGGATDRIGPLYQHPPAWDLTGSRVRGECAGYIGRRAARKAFAACGLRPDDVDVCELYDPFSFEIIRQFEAFGFCEEGAGGEFVMDGRINPGGQFPITTDGGTMSFSHAGQPQMLQRVVRGIHQLQQRCATRQVPNAEVALCSNGGAGALFTDVVLLGRGR